MTIRPATTADRARLIEMGQRFYEASPYRELLGEPDVEGFGRLVDNILAAAPHSCVAVAVDATDRPFAMVAAMASLHPFNGALIVEELAWYVDPEARGSRLAGPKLLEVLEKWATAIGAHALKVVAPRDNPAASKFYLKIGYGPVESAFVKRLGV